MRNTIFALATSALLAGAVFVGCGDDNNGTGDMAGAPDLARQAPDLTQPPKLSCSELLECYAACGADAACYDDCDSSASSAANTKLDTAIYCGQLHCLGDQDAGTGKCKIDEAAGRLVNADGSMISSSDPGTGMKACGACLDNALAGLFGGACPDTASPDCNPSQCTDENSACTND